MSSNRAKFTQILISFFAMTPLISFAEIRNLMEQNTPAKNQGNTDTCAFYAVTGLFEQALKTHFQKEFDVSEKFEWERSKLIKKQKPEVEFGDTYLLAQNLVKDNYFITEENKKIYFTGLVFHQLTQMWVKTPWSQQVIELLKKNRQTVLTLKISASDINDSTGEIVFNQQTDLDCKNQSKNCGGHAVLITGYDLDKKIFYIKNSWGPQWGQQGFGTVSFEHVDHFSDQLITLYFDRIYSPSLKDQ